MKTKEFKNRKSIARYVMMMLVAISSFVYTGCDKDDEITTYTVTFNADGGTPVPSAQSVEAGKTATAPAANPTKTGYVFLFWRLSGASTAYNFSTPVNGNIALQAKWEEESKVEYWQVSWDLNGGAWPTSGDNHATQVVKGGTLAEPAAPTKAGKVFDGWYKEAALTNKVAFPYNVSTVTANFTLYAKWTTGGITDPSGYKMFTSISELKSWLASQSANTIETAYKVGLKNVNLDSGNNWGDLGFAIHGTKFVDLYLLGCSATKIPDGTRESKYENNKLVTTTTGVFLECENLVAIVLPKGVKTIGKYAFLECYNLVSVVVPEVLTEVHTEAFKSCDRLSTFNFPDGLKSIDDHAFQYCKFTSFTAPRSLNSIGIGAFSSCYNITSITIPAYLADISWGSSVFHNCRNLTSAAIEEGIEILPANMFTECSSLESVSLPQSLRVIEQDVFNRCYALKSITLPEGLTTIGVSAFSGCSKLTSIKLPEGLKSIGWGSFRYCSGLTSLTIPAKVESIGDYAFESTGVTDFILLPITPPILGKSTNSSRAFSNSKYGKIKVPATSLNAYINAPVWNEFSAGVIVANTN